MHLFKSVVLSTMLYGFETWVPTAAHMNRLQAFTMGDPGCDEVGQEEKHRAALNGGHRDGGGHGDEEEVAMVGPRGADGRHSPPQVPPCVQARGW